MYSDPMFVITVIPISRGIGIEELSYFTAETIPEGALVSVPLRGRMIKALVVSFQDAREAKANLKTADFALKKLERVDATRGISPHFFAAVEKTAHYYNAPRGAIIHAAFPVALLGVGTTEATAPARVATSERFVLQTDDTERRTLYKSLIRESFAKQKSVYLALPSIQDIEQVYESMERGIKEYTFVLHGGLTKAEEKKRWNAAIAMKHPVLIIGTIYFLGIPRTDLAAIILDKESSSAYRLQGRPFVDLRYFAEAYAEALGAKFVVGDIMLRTETFARFETKEFESLTRPKSRFVSGADMRLVDMRVLGEQPATGRYAIYSPTLVDAIMENETSRTRMFLLGVRRGYAPMTVCGDCATVVICARCAAPVVLYKKSAVSSQQSAVAAAPMASAGRDVHEKSPNMNTPAPRSPLPALSRNVFLCHRCGHERPADFTCTHCGGWRLTALGVGIAQAEEALRGRFPDLPLFRIDRDATPTHKDARKVAEKVFATPGAVLLGTEMALPYLTGPLAHVGVLSVNSLLTIPDFRMGEKVFRLLLALRAKAERSFIVQTRDAKNEIFARALSGQIGEFLHDELAARKVLDYPPFTTFIKLTHDGSKPDGERAMADIARIFAPWSPVTFPSFIARVKGKYRMNALLKIPAGKWPDQEIATLLSALPAEIEVRVDPESVI